MNRSASCHFTSRSDKRGEDAHSRNPPIKTRRTTGNTLSSNQRHHLVKVSTG